MKNQPKYADGLICLKENETPHEAAARNCCERRKIPDAEIAETAEDVGTLANSSIFSGQYAFCYTVFGKNKTVPPELRAPSEENWLPVLPGGDGKED